MKLISSAKVFLASTAAALAIVGSYGVAAASAATAAPAHTSQVAAAAVMQQPAAKVAAKTCPIEVGRFRTYDRNCGVLERHTCFVGNQGNLNEFPKYASNGCESRVWLYPARGEQGIGLCLRPRSATHLLTRDYESFRVVSNRNPC